jgi:hypothetical protein
MVGRASKAHGHHGRADDPGGGGEEGAHDHDGDGQTARQRAEDPRHGGQKLLGDLGAFQRDAHQDEHQNRQQRLDRLARDDALVHPVDDEGDIALHRLFPAAREQVFLDPRQLGVSEDGYRLSDDPFGQQREYSAEDVSIAWWIRAPRYRVPR